MRHSLKFFGGLEHVSQLFNSHAPDRQICGYQRFNMFERPLDDRVIAMNNFERPTVSVPSGEKPNELVAIDEIVGDGAEAKPGSQVSVDYVGVSWSTGKEFDASWDRGDHFSFDLGAQQVIPGWDQGVSGMRVGGRRTLHIPPELAYGERGAPGAIAPNETLIFTVDLRSVG